METYTAVVEPCPNTGGFVGYVPGIAGAHSQGDTLEELQANLNEVAELLDLPPGSIAVQGGQTTGDKSPLSRFGDPG